MWRVRIGQRLRELRSNKMLVRGFAAAGGAAAGTGILSLPAKHPVTFGASFTSMKTTVADIFVQKVIEGRSEMDFKRTAVFASFGFAYMGVAQYFLYVKLMAERWFPNAGEYAAKTIAEKTRDVVGTRNLFAQVAIDQFWHIPFVFFPCYYTTKELIMGDPSRDISVTMSSAIKKWRKNLWEDTKASWMIWWPCNLVNFGFMPMHYRIPFMAVCSFAFCVVISLMRGGGEKKLNKEASELAKAISSSKLDTDAFVALIRKTHEKGLLKSEQGISYPAFVKVMTQIGLTDEKVVKALFQCADVDSNGGIDTSEMAALLILLACQDIGSAKAAKFVFQCFDLDQSGYVDWNELKSMLYGVLTVREATLVNGGDVNPEEAMDSLVSGSGEAKELEDLSAEQKAQYRLGALKKKFPRFRGPAGEGITLEQILQYEAEQLATQIVSEADRGDVDGRVTEEEFIAWMKTETAGGKRLQSLFSSALPQ
mmetsp:Transcript_24849/g.40047  ORF Transcript_24849/g.40047 Transcript_24849/m.40047 type:complete len:481 (-) Transcript_24849:249-1691(-)